MPLLGQRSKSLERRRFPARRNVCHLKGPHLWMTTHQLVALCRSHPIPFDPSTCIVASLHLVIILRDVLKQGRILPSSIFDALSSLWIFPGYGTISRPTEFWILGIVGKPSNEYAKSERKKRRTMKRATNSPVEALFESRTWLMLRRLTCRAKRRGLLASSVPAPWAWGIDTG